MHGLADVLRSQFAEGSGDVMKAHVLTGTKHEIAEGVIRIVGEVHEAIVFVEEPGDDPAPPLPGEDIFAEMEPYTVRQASFDDSREAIYTRMEGE